MMKHSIFAIGILLACCACSPRLVIIHTNDTHSHLEPLRGEPRGGVIERAAFVDQQRQKAGEGRTLLLHAGDFNQGSSYYTTFGGQLEVELVNAMRYDCITLGNHEFDNGIEDLTARAAQIRCPIVCASLDLSSFELGKYVKPYTVIERGGMRIGIVGLLCDITPNVSRTISARLPQLNNVEVLNKYAKLLRDEEKCDYVIALTHIGFKEDQKLAAATRGVDLIIGGHSHTFLEGVKEVNNLDGKPVPIVTDGCWGLEMGVLKIY